MYVCACTLCLSQPSNQAVISQYDLGDYTFLLLRGGQHYMLCGCICAAKIDPESGKGYIAGPVQHATAKRKGESYAASSNSWLLL